MRTWLLSILLICAAAAVGGGVWQPLGGLTSVASTNEHHDVFEAQCWDRECTADNFYKLTRAIGWDIAAVCRRGHKDGPNQDNFIVRLYMNRETNETAGLFGISDGHGYRGENLSGFVAKRAAILADETFMDNILNNEKFQQEIQDYGLERLDSKIRELLFDLFDTLHIRAMRIKQHNGGCTFLLALWYKGQLWVANVGDSPAFRIDKENRRLETLSAPGDTTDPDIVEALRKDIQSWFDPIQPIRSDPESYPNALSVSWNFDPVIDAYAVKERIKVHEELRRLLEEYELKWPKAQNRRIKPLGIQASAYISYNVVNFYGRNGERTYFPVFRLGGLAPSSGIADSDDYSSIVTPGSFIQHHPNIRRYDIGDNQAFLLTSDGFANPVYSRSMHDVFLRDVEECCSQCEADQCSECDDCLEDPFPLWLEWKKNMTMVEHKGFLKAHKDISIRADQYFSELAYEQWERASSDWEAESTDYVQRLYDLTRDLDEKLVVNAWQDDMTLMYVRKL